MDFKNVDEGHADIHGKDSVPLHFYYSREERLKNAPQNVKDLYSGKMAPRRGLFKVLVATKGNRFMLTSILIFAAFIWIFSFLSGRNARKFLGTDCVLSAFSYEESVYVSLHLKENKVRNSGEPVQHPLSVVFQVFDVSGMVSDRTEVFETYTGGELFVRTKFSDYDIMKVVATVESGSESGNFEAAVQRR